MSDGSSDAHENEGLLSRLREKRGYVRVTAPVAVAYRAFREDGGLGPAHAGTLVCLSMSGARLVTMEPLDAGTQLQLDLPIPSMFEPSTAVARVLRCLAAQEPDRWVVPTEFVSLGPAATGAIGRYIEERVREERDQQEGIVRRLSMLQDLSQVLHATMDPERILEAVVDLALELARAESGSILLRSAEADRLEFAVARGPAAEEVRAFSLAFGEGIAGWVAQHGRPLAVDDAAADPRWSPMVAGQLGYATRDLAAVPLRLQGETIGVLEVVNRLEGLGFTSDDLRVLETLAGQASVIIENARLYRQLEKSAAEARARVAQAAEKLGLWRRAAEGNMTQAAICIPLSTGEYFANEAALSLLENLGPQRAVAEERLRALLEDVRLVAPAAVRTSGSYLIQGSSPGQPLLMAHVSILVSDRGEPGALVAHLLDMRGG